MSESFCEALNRVVASQDGKGFGDLFNPKKAYKKYRPVKSDLSILNYPDLINIILLFFKIISLAPFWHKCLDHAIQLVDQWVALLKKKTTNAGAGSTAGGAAGGAGGGDYSNVVDFHNPLLNDDDILSQTWAVGGFSSVCNFLTLSALEADEKESNAATDSENETNNLHLQQVLNNVRRHIGKFRGDDNQGPFLVLLSECINLCLKLKNITMASSFLKSVPTNQALSPSAPRGPAVRFKYFYGNLLLQKEAFDQAEEPLSWAYMACSHSKTELRRSICACMIACRLRLGLVPPSRLLKEHKLEYYGEVVDAARTGNLRRFKEAMHEYETKFREDGTTLCLERVNFLAQRVLLERIYAWAQKNYFEPHQPTNIVPLALFTAGFAWQIDPPPTAAHLVFDEEEMMCVLANLIKMGLVKGYIAWEPRVLVLSKKQPFPPLNLKN